MRANDFRTPKVRLYNRITFAVILTLIILIACLFFFGGLELGMFVKSE
ncbi:hypothetical protein JCM14450A_28700 [Geobacillus stearothermophilus]